MSALFRCEQCGGRVEQETRSDLDGYLWTGRCRACRVGLAPGLVGMIERVVGGPKA